MLRRVRWKIRQKWPNLGRWLLVAFGLLIGAGGGWWFTLKDWQREDLIFRAKWAMSKRPEQLGTSAGSATAETRPYRHFATCNEARLAGYGSMTANEPSYRPELDGDRDGIACEPWPGNGRRWRWSF